MGVLALILLTGYLIIYNVFQISVAGDIRFYGLLKTIGTTPRQLRRILRNQALLLAAAGIPVGLLLGWLAGCALAPVVVRNLDSVSVVASANPWIFVGGGGVLPRHRVALLPAPRADGRAGLPHRGRPLYRG